MRWQHLFLWLALAWLTVGVGQARTEPSGWFPFVLPWDDATSSIIDVSSLNPVPAGADGFIQARDGHFWDGKGQRIRFLGVNLTFGGCFPARDEATRLAGRLRKFGINGVRLHQMDYYPAPRGLFDPRFRDTQHLDPEQLDRLDHLVYQLKQHGIYVNLNLHVSRNFTAADGFEGAGRSGKVVGCFLPRMIALQKDYARALLDRTNPYTKTRWAEEPAIAFLEINNENSLIGSAFNGRLESLPRSDREELTRQWNSWLKRKYTSTEGLRQAWKADEGERGANLLKATWRLERQPGAQAEMKEAEDATKPDTVGGKLLRITVTTPGKQAWHVQVHNAGLDLQEGQPYTVRFWARADRKRMLGVGTSLDESDWHGTGLNERVPIELEWRPFKLVFTASRTRKDHNRLVFAMGETAGTVELAGVSVRAGMEGLIPDGARVEDGSIPPARPARTPVGLDWIEFLLHTERGYNEQMRQYLKETLGTRACIVCSQANFGGLGGAYRETLSDYTDMHAYWQHPHFPHRQWDPADWVVARKAMVADARGGAFPALARYRLAGKPFTVSEYNHSAPSDYQAECLPLLTAYAAFQDWDGLYLFDYHSERDGWDRNRIPGYFSIDSNPAKMAFFPAAALLFRRGDLAPAAMETRLALHEGSLADFMIRHGPDINPAWDYAGGPWPTGLQGQMTIEFVREGHDPVKVIRKQLSQPGPSALRWTGAGTEQALFRADSARSRVLVGFLGGRTLEGSGWKVEGPPAREGFAALMLSPVDGRPVEQSRSLLLTAVGRVENQGMGWNAERTSVGKQWGQGPTRAEGIAARISLQTQARAATIHALDERGRRRSRVESQLKDCQLHFTIGPDHKTLWYEIEAD